MPTEFASFAFIITLAAVVNGLGIVRWITGLSEFIVHRNRIVVQYNWLYLAAAVFQFLLHVLLWWSLWRVRDAGALNFISYLYLLTGPILLFLGTALLAPATSESEIDLRAHYFHTRVSYATVSVLVWIWALLLAPVTRGEFAETAWAFATFAVLALIRRQTDNLAVHGVTTALNWILVVLFIVLYAMQLGGPS